MSAKFRRSRLLLVGLSSIAALLLAEGGLRLFGYDRLYVNGVSSFHEHDPYVGLRGKPDFAGVFRQPDFDVRVELDSRGFRKASQPQAETSEPRTRLFVLGDSFTWGWGVDQGQAFPELLAERMPELEVHNLGLSGTGTVIQFKLFERYVRDDLRSGDVVLLAFYENDLPDNLGQRMEEWAHARVVEGRVEYVAPPAPELSVRIKNVLKDRSYLGNLIAFIADGRKIRRRQAAAEERTRENLVLARDATRSPEEQPLEYPDDSDEVVVFRNYLQRFAAEVEGRGARFALVCIPGRTVYGEGVEDASARPLEAARHRAALRVARSLELETLDLLPTIEEFLSSADAQRLTFHHDPHWNAAGHRLAARHIEPFLRDVLAEAAPRLPE